MTIDGWLELIPHLERVGIFRHPLSVAQSLAARNKFPTEKSLKIWFRYNSLLLREYQRQPFPIISFDAKKEDFCEMCVVWSTAYILIFQISTVIFSLKI